MESEAIATPASPVDRSRMMAAGQVLGCAATAVVLGAILVSVGQPVFAEDTWWHLAMGRAYAAAGPWLDADPLLFTPRGAPAPAAWLAGLGLHGVESLLGFHGLRVAHVLLVGAIFALALRALWRTSGSLLFACLGTAVFAAMSAYRLFQLRPELLTILFALLTIEFAVLRTRRLEQAGAAMDRAGVVSIVVIFALWVNMHAGFLLGPILLGAALAGVVLFGLVSSGGADRERIANGRVRVLAAALFLGTLATLLNPTGAAPHLLYFEAGGETPDLALVADEWARFPLFDLPRANLPPSWLGWCATWALAIAFPVAGLAAWWRPSPATSARVDPALLAVGAASLSAMLLAVRFSWMSIFVWLALGQALRTLGLFDFDRARGVAIGMLAALSLGWAFAFFPLGDWPMISRGVQRATYAAPYPAGKHHAHTVWFLADSGLEGRIFNDYQSGNFLGYWLAPRLRTFVNGSLNVPRERLADAATIASRAWQSETAFETLLERYEIDVFFGSSLPRLPRANRPSNTTTRHLENTEGWIPIYRNLTSALYLRDDPGNQANLSRVEAYYAERGVPFDRQAGGFVAREVIRQAPAWATANALIPRNWRRIVADASAADPGIRVSARNRRAEVLAILGEYETAAKIDRGTLSVQPSALGAARRLLYSLLHLGQWDPAALDEALVLADALEPELPAGDIVARRLINAARNAPALEPAARRAVVSQVPLFIAVEQRRVSAGFVRPEARH